MGKREIAEASGAVFERSSLKADHDVVASAAGVVSFATILSRVLGFARDMVIANIFGARMVTDAFFVAFAIPNMLRKLFGEGALSAAFVPVFTEQVEREGKKEAAKLAGAAYSAQCIVLACITLGGIILSPQIVWLMVPGFAKYAEKLATTVKLTQLMFPYLFLIGMAVVAMGVLNSLKRFAMPALSPAALNLAMIGAAYLIAPRLEMPIMGLAVGVLIGGAAQLAMHVPHLKKEGMLSDLNLAIFHPRLKQIYRLMLPATAGMAVAEINMFVDRLLASFLPEGSVSYLYYGNHIVQFPLGVFGIAVGVAVLPVMSSQAAKKQYEQLKETFAFALRLVIFIMLPSMAAFFVLGKPMINVLFQRGQFSAQAADMTNIALFYYSIGLLSYAGVKVVAAAFYAVQDMSVPVKISIWSMIANVLLSVILMFPLKHGGLALATSISSTMNFALLALILRGRMGRMGGYKVAKSALKVSVASAVMAMAVGGLAARFFDDAAPLPSKAAFLGLDIGLGIVLFLAICYLLRCDELAYLSDFLKRRYIARVQAANRR